jgi:hypothetical protein
MISFGNFMALLLSWTRGGASGNAPAWWRLSDQPEEHRMARQARIVRNVTYREGDGPQIPIRPGPCEIVESEQDVTISWTEGETHGSTAIPLSDFKRYVAKNDILLLD